MLSGAINVINSNVITLANEKGTALRNIVPMRSLDRAGSIYKHISPGRVMSQVANPVIRMAPNWMGGTPNAVKAGEETTSYYLVTNMSSFFHRPNFLTGGTRFLKRSLKFSLSPFGQQ